MKNKENQKYYLGLDIGTDSVGYAVSDPRYKLLKFKQEPAWGVTTFEAASLAQDRRMYRTQRRRYDRRQQRVKLVEELFAAEIGKIDPSFFLRRHESALCPDDKKNPFYLISGNKMQDKEYANRYPTIHHLIDDLMKSDEPHDVRLVFIACAWLVAHRGHFLFDVDADHVSDLLDFNAVYQDFCDYFASDLECALPWNSSVKPETILKIMQMNSA